MQQSQLDHAQVAREIAEKLGRTAGVSYTDIAKKAADQGRTQLAIKVNTYISSIYLDARLSKYV